VGDVRVRIDVCDYSECIDLINELDWSSILSAVVSGVNSITVASRRTAAQH